MAKKKHSTKKTSAQRNLSHSKPAAKKIEKTASIASEANSPAQSPDNGDGRLTAFSMEGASLAENIEETAATSQDARSAEIVSEIPEGLRERIVAAIQRYFRLRQGTHRAADRVLVREELNGSVYSPLSRSWSMQVIYFPGDPVGNDQFGRIFKEIFN